MIFPFLQIIKAILDRFLTILALKNAISPNFLFLFSHIYLRKKIISSISFLKKFNF